MTLRIVHFMRRPRPGIFSMERLYEDVRAALPNGVHACVWVCRYASTGILNRWRDAWAARKEQGDVNHVTGDTHYLTYFLDRHRTILTIHDLVSIERSRGLKKLALWFFWYWLPVARSRCVVTISEAIRQALLRSVRCDPNKVIVVHNPVSDEFRPIPKQFDSVCPRILHIGTTPNKNLPRVAEALEGIDCMLVVIGILPEDQAQVLERHGIRHENRFNLSRQELLEEYARADVLMFASTYEGFGLPIIEANAVGRPVVTSNLPPMPEVAGEAACLVDPHDVSSIREGLLRIMQDAAYRETLIERGFANASRFRSSVVASRYMEVYRAVADAVPSPV